jgi:twitching motility protein PilT
MNAARSTQTFLMQKIDRFLKLMNDYGASDFHVTVGRPPMLRAAGAMETIRYRTLSEADFVEMMQPVTPPRIWAEWQRGGDADFSYEIPGVARYRVNIFRQQRGAGAVFRVIPTKIMTIDQLGLPEQVRRIAQMKSGLVLEDLGMPEVISSFGTLKRGLVLVTGPTGSGKSTTLAAIIDLINETRSLHIITIEDPIEFVHGNKKSLIHQREIGAHAKSFAEALKAAGREDPDLILVGEMRDLETIHMALSAAERGTLVLGTLHTNNAAKTMDRVISVFPASEQDGVRNVLGEVIRAVIAQQLLPKNGGGRIAALEILFATPAIGNMIREGKTSQITSAIQTGIKEGMIDMDTSLRKLFDEEKISARAAYDKAIDKEQFKELLEKEQLPA